MKSSLLESYKLHRRINALESMINERTVGPNGQPSKAYQIWDYLMNNGPTSVDDLKSALPKDITKYINFFADNDLLHKNGNMISANANYSWDNVGVIPRTAQQELMQDIRNNIDAPSMDDLMNAMNTPEDEIPQEAPAPARRGRQPQERPARTPRVREVKKNLFSKKFEEVKAAVDAGEDVNQRNDKGQTPLLFACNSRTGGNGDIIAYLVQHGADIAASHKGANSFLLACKNRNDEAVKVLLENDTNYAIRAPYNYFVTTQYKVTTPELAELAASRERGKFNPYLHRFYHWLFARDIISLNQYEKIMSTIIENSDGIYEVSRPILDDEIREGTIITINEFAKKFKYLIMPYIETLKNPNRNTKDLERLLELCRECASGNLKRNNLSIEEFLDIYYALAEITGAKLSASDYDAMFNNAEFLSKLTDDEVGQVVYDSFKNKNTAILNALVKNKVRRCPVTTSISIVLRFINNNNNKDLTKTLIKLTNKKFTNQLKYYTRDVAKQVVNEYFIEYLVDAGMGDSLYETCLGSVGLSETDNACVKVLKENGYEFPSNYQDSSDILQRIRLANGAKNTRDYMISKIIDSIERDEWSRGLEASVTGDPTLLLEDEVQDAIEQNNTFTSRQLKRKIAALPKDVYDL